MNLAISMVAEEDLQFILNIKKGCCGSKAKFYRLASREEYENWRDG